MFDDLRQFIQKAQELNECRTIEGADWDQEIGAISELMAKPGTPLLLFDKIKGYKPGYRVVANMATTPRRVALLLGLPMDLDGMDLVKAWREKTKGGYKPVPPVEVKTGPVKENVLTGDQVDLFKFPAPKWHPLDGGRYLGTADMIIMRDPDENWVNFGAYRVQVHDKNTATVYLMPGQQAKIIRDKYWARGLACPAAVVCGEEPQMFLVSGTRIPWGICEYDYLGWWRNKPVEVTRGVSTDLPLPAHAEIVLEGEIVPPDVDSRLEGPFGEGLGYYATASRQEAAFRVKSVLHRNDPIILGIYMYRRQPLHFVGRNIMYAADLWNYLDNSVPGVKGVWFVEEAQREMPIVSIKQQYVGHAKQTAMAVKAYPGAATESKWVIIVDDDIDPSDMSQVIWALATRCGGERSVEVIKECWATALDPMLSPEQRAKGDYSVTATFVIACKPYSWIKDFPPTVQADPAYLAKVAKKWEKQLK